MNKFLLLMLCVVFFSVGVFAQKLADEYNKVEVFAGYAGSLNSEDFYDASPLENGVDLSAVYNFRRYAGIKFDVSGTFKKVRGNYEAPFGAPPIPPARFIANHSLYNAEAGIQFKNNKVDAQIKPFGHVLVGVGKHTDRFTTACPIGAVCPPFNNDFTGISFVLGGGVDVKVNRRIDIRVIQLDLNTISYRSGGNRFTSFSDRFSTGVVFKF